MLAESWRKIRNEVRNNADILGITEDVSITEWILALVKEKIAEKTAEEAKGIARST